MEEAGGGILPPPFLAAYILIFTLNLLFVLVLVAVVLAAGIGFSLKQIFGREKIRPFECGVSPKFSARLPFSIRFFLLTLVFLIFDIELVLIFPFLSRFPGSDLVVRGGILFRFLFLLFVGIIHEWNQGTLDWAV